MLATVDEAGQPRVRPVSPVRVDHARLGAVALGSGRGVRITGTAFVETDAAVLRAIWEGNPLLRRYLGTPENPELIIYRVEPSRVRFMREWALEYAEVPPGA